MIVTVTIVLAEITLVLVIVLAVIGARAWRRRRRDRAAVDTLVTSIKTHQPARVEKLAGVLRSSGQLNDEDALGKANELIKKQNKFFQDAIDLYFTRNHDVLSKLDARLEELLGQYQGIMSSGEGQAAAIDNAMVEQLSGDIAALSKELEKLRQENAVLTDHLKAAEHELDQLGREYVSAFNKPKVSPARVDSSMAAPDALDGAEAEDAVAPAAEAAPAAQQEDAAAPGDDNATEVAAPPDEANTAMEGAVHDAGVPGNVTSHNGAESDESAKGILTDLDLAELLAEPDEPAKVKQS